MRPASAGAAWLATSAPRSRSAAPGRTGRDGPRGSRTHRKNGTMKTAYQIAVNGPTKRVPSRAAASSPSAGGWPSRVSPVVALSANSASITTSDSTPPT